MLGTKINRIWTIEKNSKHLFRGTESCKKKWEKNVNKIGKTRRWQCKTEVLFAVQCQDVRTIIHKNKMQSKGKRIGTT